jgi:hypothetical protein
VVLARAVSQHALRELVRHLVGQPELALAGQVVGRLQEEAACCAGSRPFGIASQVLGRLLDEELARLQLVEELARGRRSGRRSRRRGWPRWPCATASPPAARARRGARSSRPSSVRTRTRVSSRAMAEHQVLGPCPSTMSRFSRPAAAVQASSASRHGRRQPRLDLGASGPFPVEDERHVRAGCR